MYYIDRKLKNSRKDLTYMHIGPTLLVFVAFMGLTIWNYNEAQSTLQDTKSSILQSRMIETRDEIANRLTVYENVVRAGAGLFEGSEEVSRDEWKSFIDIMDLDERYQGVQSLGYIAVLRPTDLEAHIQSVKQTGIMDYSVSPSGQRDIYTSIVYIEPMSPENAIYIGTDIYVEPSRKLTLDTAAKTGQPAITAPVNAILNEDITIFSMFLPVYAQGSNPQTETERLQNLRGYIYAGFRANNFFKNVSQSTLDDNYGYVLTDKDSQDNVTLYESPTYSSIKSEANTNSSVLNLNIANKEWTISGTTSADIISESDRSRPSSVLWGGILFSVLVAGLIYTLLLNRTQKYEKKESSEIQNAKDELLALASHQLRTPATGVKQYIGMLKEGYVGELTQEQHNYIEKAYQINERQLNTINEMLVVAHADAGNMKLSLEKLDIVGLMKEIVEEQKSSIEEKGQSVSLNLPKHAVKIDIDQRYMRMALENILSNANKYTENKGSIKVMLYKSHKSVTIIVRDNGVGVDPADFPLLFKKFSRIPNELTNRVSGSGIGLYLSKKIIEAHKGTIEFQSKVGRGSKCVVTIPLNQTQKKM